MYYQIFSVLEFDEEYLDSISSTVAYAYNIFNRKNVFFADLTEDELVMVRLKFAEVHIVTDYHRVEQLIKGMVTIDSVFIWHWTVKD